MEIYTTFVAADLIVKISNLPQLMCNFNAKTNKKIPGRLATCLDGSP